jgi:hypothetical protein
VVLVTLVRLQGRWVGTFDGRMCIGRLPVVLRWLDEQARAAITRGGEQA